MKPTNNRIQRDAPTSDINSVPRRVDNASVAAPGEHDEPLATHVREHQPLIADERVLYPGARRAVEAQPAPQPGLVRRVPRDLAAGEEGSVAHGVRLGVQRGRSAGCFDLREGRVRLQRDRAVGAEEAAEGRPVRVQVYWERLGVVAGGRFCGVDELDCAQHAAWGC